MKSHTRAVLAAISAFAATLLCSLSAFAADALPSWNDTAAKKAIVAFVEQVTKEGSPNFVPVAERIATFDNDGTLWVEQPMYIQLAFALDRVKALARGGRTSANRVLVDLIESGLEARNAEKERFFALTDRLAESKSAAERRRIKEELARLTFGD